MIPERQKTGAEGELFAARWLADNGFQVLHQNWRQGRYEIDIVAQKQGVLHIVEVKTRKAKALTTPEEAITPAKFAALTKAAQAYIESYRIDTEIQFDLVAIEYVPGRSPEIRYIPEAMQPQW